MGLYGSWSYFSHIRSKDSDIFLKETISGREGDGYFPFFLISKREKPLFVFTPLQSDQLLVWDTWPLQYPRGRGQCISYMNTDPECLMFIFRIKLIKINIENLNGFAVVINWSAEFLTQLTDGKDTPWTVDVSSFLLLKHASQVVR